VEHVGFTMKHGGFIWLKQWFLCHCPTLFHSMEEKHHPN
jgi:hypothetical protein